MKTVRLHLAVALVASAMAAPACALDQGELGALLAQCVACHGSDGVAKDVEIPNLKGQHDRYMAEQLRNFRSGKRKSAEMHYLSRHLTDEEIEALTQYFSQMPH
jgi:cytochrome c553